ncbi:hypothetical protein GS415_00665 [Rhodococcus hoagii]|nr:hypothetical protein [Prescottella equi]
MNTAAVFPRLIVGSGVGVGVVEGDPNPTDPPADPQVGGENNPQQQEQNPDAPKLNEHGYPDGVPVVEMTIEQQMAYWKRNSRKHEARANAGLSAEDAQALREENARLKTATMTADEQAIATQVDTARAEGEAAARAALMPVIHQAQLVGYGSTVISGERLQAWVSSANPASFVGEDGDIDGERVRTHLVALFGDPNKEEKPAPTATHVNWGQGAPLGGNNKPQRGQAGLEALKKRGHIKADD